jgi:hypothetical protein
MGLHFPVSVNAPQVGRSPRHVACMSVSKINASTELTFGTPATRQLRPKGKMWSQPELMKGPKLEKSGATSSWSELPPLRVFTLVDVVGIERLTYPERPRYTGTVQPMVHNRAGHGAQRYCSRHTRVVRATLLLQIGLCRGELEAR